MESERHVDGIPSPSASGPREHRVAFWWQLVRTVATFSPLRDGIARVANQAPLQLLSLIATQGIAAMGNETVLEQALHIEGLLKGLPHHGIGFVWLYICAVQLLNGLRICAIRDTKSENRVLETLSQPDKVHCTVLDFRDHNVDTTDTPITVTAESEAP